MIGDVKASHLLFFSAPVFVQVLEGESRKHIGNVPVTWEDDAVGFAYFANIVGRCTSRDEMEENIGDEEGKENCEFHGHGSS